MTLTDFATRYNLRVERDDCDDLVILGRVGHLYEYSPAELGLMILSEREPHPRLWNSIREKCLAIGMTCRQTGDAEGALSFDPNNREQARLAIKVTGVRPKRQMSEERRQAQVLILEKARQARKISIREGGSEPFFALQDPGLGQTMAILNLADETPCLIENSSLGSIERSE